MFVNWYVWLDFPIASLKRKFPWWLWIVTVCLSSSPIWHLLWINLIYTFWKNGLSFWQGCTIWRLLQCLLFWIDDHDDHYSLSLQYFHKIVMGLDMKFCNHWFEACLACENVDLSWLCVWVVAALLCPPGDCNVVIQRIKNFLIPPSHCLFLGPSAPSILEMELIGCGGAKCFQGNGGRLHKCF